MFQEVMNSSSGGGSSFEGKPVSFTPNSGTSPLTYTINEDADSIILSYFLRTGNRNDIIPSIDKGEVIKLNDTDKEVMTYPNVYFSKIGMCLLKNVKAGAILTMTNSYTDGYNNILMYK